MEVDFIIVGQGLAGSALSMALMRRGKSVAVVDSNDPSAATRVAAGLVTTLAGKGMNQAWRQAEYLPEAIFYYQDLERESGTQLFYPHSVLRLFKDLKEVAKFGRKVDSVKEWVVADVAEIPPNQLHADFGGFEMAHGGRLDTAAYLKVVRQIIESEGLYLEQTFDEESVELSAEGVSWNGIHAQKIILCQGYAGLAKGRFSNLKHRSAKGEMLTVRVNQLDSERVISRNGWMVPIGDKLWRAGATYEWDDLSTNPTAEGCSEVEQKVTDLTSLPFEVVGHEVGVRPIIHRSQPVIGLDSTTPQIGFFNGLGSKGVITAPSVAEHFTSYLLGESELDPELSLARVERT
ncbi:MAG: FAD-dependent oxidoreductase [Rubritalea sp.]|uniref:NAD(P)/FAD-dependent oxidoreductase n=1 Tax=Rubritalea sp. TaxID=2109375 RepID=UPI003241F59E